MFGGLKLVIIILLGLIIFLSSNRLSILTIASIENIWITVYCISQFFFLWFEDLLYIYIGLVVIVIAACEVVMLATLFYFESRSN